MDYDPYTLAILGAQMQESSAKQANEWNVALWEKDRAWSEKQAQKQMDFQERMSSTAHQREMADLIKAGLNPILTATGGAGASAMSGASAQSQSPTMQAGLKSNPMQNVAQDKLAAKRFQELELENLKLNAAMNEQNIAQSKSQTNLNEKSLGLMDANILSALEQINTQRSQQYLNSASAIRQQADAALSGAQMRGVELENYKKEVTRAPYQIVSDMFNLPALKTTNSAKHLAGEGGIFDQHTQKLLAPFGIDANKLKANKKKK